MVYYTAKLCKMERMKNSSRGNPRYKFFLHFEEPVDDPHGCRHLSGYYQSQSNAAFCYTIGNAGLREGDLVDVAFSVSGRILSMVAHGEFGNA